MSGAMLMRHRLATRIVHAVNALVVLVLIVTGLALGDVIPDRMAWLLGGHLGVDAVHRLLGVVFAAALLLLVLAAPRKVARLLGNVCHLRRGDWRWPLRFTAFLVAPQQYAPPFHDGHFDPVQRGVFLGILVTLALASASGVYLYAWTPAFPLGQLSMAYAIRVHIGSVWVLIACIALHIFAGSGVLWTHRGITTAMFGNGKVPARMAQNLWPACMHEQPSQQQDKQ